MFDQIFAISDVAYHLQLSHSLTVCSNISNIFICDVDSKQKYNKEDKYQAQYQQMNQ